MAAQTLYDKLWESQWCVPTRTAPRSCISTAISSTKPPARRPLKGSSSPAASRGAHSIVATADHNTPTGQLGFRVLLDQVIRFRACRWKRWMPTCVKPARWRISRSWTAIRHVHVVGPEQGATLPGMTVVCGDSHTSTHGVASRAGDGYRHQRGRARHGDPVPDRQEVQGHAGTGRG